MLFVSQTLLQSELNMIANTKFDQDECRQFIELSKTYYSSPETTDENIINWKFAAYKDHPSYHLKYFFKGGSELIGRAVLNKRYLNLFGEKKEVTQVTDLLISKQHKSMLGFIELIRNFSSLKTEGVIHTSNENSEKIYADMFKFQEVLNLSAYAFPLRISKLLHIKNVFILYISNAIYFFFKIFFKMINAYSPCRLHSSVLAFNLKEGLVAFEGRNTNLERSVSMFQWRYQDSPCGYTLQDVFWRSQQIGILASRVTEFNGAKYFFIMDFCSFHKLSYWQNLFIRIRIINEAIFTSSDAVFGLFNAKNKDSNAFCKFPLIPIGDKMLPHRTPLFASSFGKNFPIHALGSMYFSLGDLDYF